MLRRFTDYTIKFLELLEAEAQSAGRGLVRAGLNIALALAGVGLVFIALALCGLALYLALEPSVGPAGAVALTAALILLLGGVLVWLANSRSTRS